MAAGDTLDVTVPGPNPEERASRPLNSKPFFKMSARQPWQLTLTDDAKALVGDADLPGHP